MGNVIGLNGLPKTEFRAPDDGLISAVENALEVARSGKLQSLVATGFTDDGMRFSLFGGHHENLYEMLGSINWLEHEYVYKQSHALDR